jgi:uncharacterized Zn finger protein
VSRYRRWDGDGWYEPAPKKPPPEHGIRMKKAGTTWWGKLWIEALEQVLGGDAGRLARGRTYARAGRTHDLVVKDGKVTAGVTGSRPTPYEITLALTQLSEPVWKQAIDGMAQKAQFSAELLAGQMPQQIDEVFRAAGVSLFPKQRTDLQTSCSCPDWGDPCKHVAATHYILGEALDRDPFLLFELRGKTKEQVLEALRAARGGVDRKTSSKRGKANPARDSDPHDAPGVKLGKLKAADYDKPRQTLPALQFSFDAPATHGAVLRQLGAPAAWQSEASPADVLAPLVRAAAETARRMAMAVTEPSEAKEPPEPPAASPATPTPTPTKKATRPMRRTRKGPKRQR